MSLKYKVVELVNPAKREEPKKFYAQLAESGRVDLDEIANSISETSTTVSHIDVHAVLLALTDELLKRLERGESVHLGKLGYFHTTIQSKGQAKESDVTASSIEGVKVRFVAGDALKDKLKSAHFEKVEKAKTTEPKPTENKPAGA